MKKIACYFNGRTKFGGAERRISRIFDELSCHGYNAQIILLCFEPIEEVRKTFESMLKHKKVEFFLAENYIQVIKYITKEKFDWICYTDAYFSMVPFLLAGIFSGSRRLMLNVSTSYSMLRFKKLRHKFLFELVARCSHQIDVLYPSALVRLQKHFPRHKITLTPCPFTDLNSFFPAKKEKLIVFAGRLIDIKNAFLFVNSITVVADLMRQHGYKALLCGDGPQFNELKAIISKHNINDIVDLTGYMDTRSIFLKAKVFLSLQNYNNYPSQSLLEATACGCYIIATNIGDTDRIVKKEFGSLVGYDENEIGKELKKYIIMDINEQERIVRSASKFAKDNFRIERSVEHYSKIFN